MSNVEDITAVCESWLAAFNTRDVAALLTYAHPEETSFGGLGALLAEGNAANEEYIKGMFEAGLKPDLQWRHLKVKVFGSTAVSTGYLVGTVHLPDGNILDTSWRNSMMWIRQEETWKYVHSHSSALTEELGE